MTKNQAIKMFGSRKNLADALGVTRQAVSLWPARLPQRLSDEINGAFARIALEKGQKAA